MGLKKRILKREKTDIKALDTSRKALHLCLDCIKKTKDENELRRLAEELQRIVFHRQYRNAGN